MAQMRLFFQPDLGKRKMIDLYSASLTFILVLFHEERQVADFPSSTDNNFEVLEKAFSDTSKGKELSFLFQQL